MKLSTISAKPAAKLRSLRRRYVRFFKPRAQFVAPVTDDGRYRFSADWFSSAVPEFRRYLAPLAGQPCRLLEIGSYEGRSATWLADNLMGHPAAVLDCIEINIKDLLRANIAASGRAGQIRVLEGPSGAILPTLPPNSYDFVYIDGRHWHLEVMEDAVLSFRLLKAGGIIAFDDYLWDDKRLNIHGTPKAAIDAFVQLYARKLEVLHKDYQVWVRKTCA
jgi:predicted O-methyltransferase YrrM